MMTRSGAASFRKLWNSPKPVTDSSDFACESRLLSGSQETTQAEWLHEVIRDLVKEVVVCNPRRNKLLTAGSKGDKIDARKLAELLRAGLVESVWHGHDKTRRLKQMVRAYETFSVDTQRTMTRIKSMYRSRGIRTAGIGVYSVRQREQWLGKLPEAGMRQRVAWLYEQLDQVRELRKQAKAQLIAEGRRHRAVGLLRTIPQLGPIRSAQIVATADTPYRFRTKRQFLQRLGRGHAQQCRVRTARGPCRISSRNPSTFPTASGNLRMSSGPGASDCAGK